jgi:hypothetical protein
MLVRSRVFRRGIIATATCGIFVTLVEQFGAPILGNTSCGLLIPHEHILIGQADTHDLEHHLAVEAKCAAGKPDTPDEQFTELQGSKGHILQLIHFDGWKTAYLGILSPVMATLPAVVVVRHLQPLHSWLEEPFLPGQSASIRPPKPPPRSA